MGCRLKDKIPICKQGKLNGSLFFLQRNTHPLHVCSGDTSSLADSWQVGEGVRKAERGRYDGIDSIKAWVWMTSF